MNPKRYDYRSFLKARTKAHWNRIGTRRAAGVAVPLFSIHSRQSIGLGEIPDLKILIDWCRRSGLKIIQLLPINDVGMDFLPYDAKSAFALDPMYLRLEGLGIPSIEPYLDQLEGLRRQFPPGKPLVNYKVKAAKLSLLWHIFSQARPKKNDPRFRRFLKKNRYWIHDYAMYNVLKKDYKECGWQSWPERFRSRNQTALRNFSRRYSEKIHFYKWLQWELFKQFEDVRRYAKKRRVYLVGDIPFLVARDSAEVWAHQQYFLLDREAGAPPDSYSDTGQRWGMPPYHWAKMSVQGYRYLVERLKCAEHFYDLYRIDHFIGLFRLWTIKAGEPLDAGATRGEFDPQDESLWRDQGIRLIDAMLKATRMMPCAEDLGVVPKCSFEVLEDYAICGMDIARWLYEPHPSNEPVDVRQYRKNSMVVLSTHDMSTLREWWEKEISHDNPKARDVYWKFVGGRDRPSRKMNPKIAEKILLKINQSASILSVHTIQDWLCLESDYRPGRRLERINVPATWSPKNWRYVMPYSLEGLQGLELHKRIRLILKKSHRF